MLFVGAAMFGMFYFLSLSMQQVLGYSALETGLAQLPLAGTLILAAGAIAPLVTRLGSKPVTLAGLATFAAGVAWLSRMPADADFVTHLLGPSIVVGIGLPRPSSRSPSAPWKASPTTNPALPAA